MIKCPNAECGYENVDGTQFCEGCGEELPQSTGVASGTTTAGASGAAATTAAGMVKCPACDNMNPADNVVCEVCGTELNPATGAAPISSAPAGSTAAPSTFSTPSSTQDPSVTVASPGMSTPATPGVPAVDPLATGTATPPTSFSSPGSDPMVSTTSTAAPSALAGNLGPNTSADLSMPVVAAGDATSGVSPTGTTLPNADATIVAPTSASSPVSGGVASSDPVVTVSADDTSVTPTTVPLGAAPIASAPTGNLQPGAVKLTVEQGMTIGKQFVLGDPELLVGREDEEEGIYPDIDLSDQDEGYVHRKHAQIRFENGGLTVTHLGGANKTRVNNRPLADNTPQAVNIGDKVSFGKVVMRVGPA